MPTFSQRYGYVAKPMQHESMTIELRNRIWNIYKGEVSTDYFKYRENYLEEILDHFGLLYEVIENGTDVNTNLKRLRKWYEAAEWYEVYDFIEVYLNYLTGAELIDARDCFNIILQQENAGYRISGTCVIPITSGEELACVEKAQSSPYYNVNTHIKKATELFSNRPTPDYENSIKESISAVEALCCIIVDNKKATLGQALKKIEDQGITIHPAFISGISSLYGYASDEGGIRHGSIDFTGANSEDAKYMLVSCSAFVNYLIEKWEKVK